MSRLPTLGGDTDAWGTLLNDYLTEAAFHGVLASSPGAGATTFDVAVVPPGLIIGSLVLIDAYTTEAELRAVTNISGGTLTVAATKYAHASGDTLLVLNDHTVSPRMYGAAGGTTDDWAPIQRMVLEAAANAVKCRHMAAVVGAVWLVSKPICVLTSSQWENIGLKTHSSYGPVDAAGALCMLGQRQFSFTAAASSNVFTVAAGHGMTPGGLSETTHTKVVFNNPYGETLPGGVTAGKVYYIDTVPNTTTFTVSATKGGGILDVTADGTGYAWESIGELSRVYWDNVRFDLNKADVSGLILDLQQPAYVRNLRVEMQIGASAPDTVFGVQASGQIGYFDNVEINTNTNCTGMSIAGTGIVVRGFNCDGGNSGDTAMVISGSGVTVSEVWTESVGTAGIRIGTGRSIAILGGFYHSGNSPAVLVESIDCSYELGPIYVQGGSEVVQDDGRSLTFYNTGGADPHYIVTDYDGRFPGWSQLGCQFGSTSTHQTPPQFKSRVRRAAINENYDVSFKDELVVVVTTGGSRTITLPPVASFDGYTFRIHNSSDSNSSIVVDTEDTSTIDGAASVTVAVGQTLSVLIAYSQYHVLGAG